MGGLGPIRAVTITSHDPRAAAQAWTQYLDYRVVDRGQLASSTAVAWSAPDLEGAEYITLAPASWERTCVRFVKQYISTDLQSSATHGWVMAEITVQDTDELHEKLRGSPFRVTHPPHDVPTYSYLRAMLAVGPAGEHLALTWIKEPRPDLAAALSFVGRCFIAVQSVPDLAAAMDFYRATFGNACSPIRKLPLFDLAVITLGEGAKLELDQHPTERTHRQRDGRSLPPGLAMVSFDCTDFDSHRDRFIAPPVRQDGEPFDGRRIGVMEGPSGALIELIERADATI